MYTWVFPRGLYLSRFPTKTVHEILFAPLRATCPAQLILHDLTTRMICVCCEVQVLKLPVIRFYSCSILKFKVTLHFEDDFCRFFCYFPSEPWRLPVSTNLLSVSLTSLFSGGMRFSAVTKSFYCTNVFFLISKFRLVVNIVFFLFGWFPCVWILYADVS
jgi:hypothetical protein